MNAVKWIAISIVATLSLLAILLISLKNWNWARGIITQQISDITGRNFNIRGNLNVDLSLTPHIRIEQVQFGNADWSKQSNMLELAASLKASNKLAYHTSHRVLTPLLSETLYCKCRITKNTGF